MSELSRQPVPENRSRRWRRWGVLAMYLLFATALVWAWRHAGLRQWLEPEALAALGRRVQAWPAAPLAVVGCYVLGVMLALPVTVLVAVAAMVFGPWWGMAYAMSGMLAGALVGYGVGRLSGDWVADIGASRFQAVAHGLRRHGLAAVIFVRVVPVAPFLLVNLSCGALRVPLRDYLVGSLVGLTPAVVLFNLFTDRLIAAIVSPGPATVAGLLGVVVLAWLAVRWFKRRVRQQQRGGAG